MTTATAADAATSFSVIDSVSFNSPPAEVAVDTANHQLYVTNPTNNTVTVVDERNNGNTSKVIASIAVGTRPTQIAVDPVNHNVYVINSSDNTVAVIDESGDKNTGTVTKAIPVGSQQPESSLPGGIAVDPTNHNVYITNRGDNTVSLIDESGDKNTGAVTATIPVGQQPEAVAVDPTNHNVYVTNPDDNTVSVIDESGDKNTGTVTATIPAGPNPEAIAVDPTNHNVYVANTTPVGTVTVIDEAGDANNGKVIATIVVDVEDIEAVDPDAIAVDPVNHNVYVLTISDGDFVINKSGDSRTFTVTNSFSAGGRPLNVAVDPSDHNIYITDYYDGTMAVLRPVTTPSADLAITVGGPSSAPDNTQLTLKVTVANEGPSPADGVATSFFVPSGLTVESAPGAVIEPGVLIWNDPVLADGATVTYTVTLAVGKNVHTVASMGGVTESSIQDPNLANNVAITSVRLG